jgi:hypothetical protein
MIVYTLQRSIPTHSDFITFLRLENLHVAMPVKHNHTSFDGRPGDHYMPFTKVPLG